MDDQEASKSAAQIPFVNFKGWNLKKIVSSTFKLRVIKSSCLKGMLSFQHAYSC
jgi:hypothetical protein